MHLDQQWVRDGDQVRACQQIGVAGNTGGVAPHLHFEIHDGPNNPVDPEPLLQWPELGLPANPQVAYDRAILTGGDNKVATAVGPDGIIYLFVIGLDNQPYWNWRDPATGLWSGFGGMGGQVRNPL